MNLKDKKILDRLKPLNVIIVSHIFSSGPALDLEDFLKTKVKELTFIGHPFSYRKDVGSFYRYYKNGILYKEHNAISWRLPEVLYYFKDFIYTIFWIISNNRNYDLYVGSDNYTAFMGLILKKLGKVKEVILYTIDYMPNRFKNKLLNNFYHFFDYQCLKNCKIVWNVSTKIAEVRFQYKGIDDKNFAPQIVVPLGMWYRRIPKISIDKKIKNQMVFLGHLLEKQGVDIAIEAISIIAKKISNIRLLIIGTGPYEKYLKDLTKKEKVEKFVSFTGYIEDHKEVENKLAESTLAIAMYKPEPDNFTYFADPAKIKNYLVAGLPVILTDVPPIAKELVSNKCGMISEYNRENFAKKVINILLDKKMLNSYSKNAVEFSKQFDWDKVFPEALSKSI